MKTLSRAWSVRLAALGMAAGLVFAVSQRALAKGAESVFAYTITSPGTGYQIIAGSTVVVTWTSTANNGNVNLSLVDSAAWTVVATHNNTADDGSEPFTIPANMPAGRYLIYIEDVGVTEWAFGDEFDVLECGTSALRQQSTPRARIDTSRPPQRPLRRPRQD